MGEYLDTYSKYLIANKEFFEDMVQRLLAMQKINKELILKAQRRLRTLKLIEEVSPSLHKYFYGKDYEDILDQNIFMDLEKYVDYLLRYSQSQIDIKVSGERDENLCKICSKSYESIHNYNCSNKVQINLNSNEIFLEDYEEINELCFLINEVACSNINFKVIDVVNNTEYFEDRINEKRYRNYVNTKITLIKISDYRDFIKAPHTNEFLLNRMSFLDPNPIWNYYLLEKKVNSRELPSNIIKYASYVKENFESYAYLDEELYKSIGINALTILCDNYIEIDDYDKFEECFEELRSIECNLLELIYLRAKSIIKSNNFKINTFLEELREDLLKNPNKCSNMNLDSKSLYRLIGEMLETQGNYIGAGENYFKSGELLAYINKLGSIVSYLNKTLYKENEYFEGIILTPKINTNYKFISDRINIEDINEVIGKDHTRLFSFELCAKEIKEYKISGEIVELSSNRSDFSLLLNEAFYERKHYLFDINEKENIEGSIDDIISTRENVIFKKWTFLKEAEELTEKFCFVSIDVNEYKLILESLLYFYERLSPGGYIFINYYNYKLYEEVSRAVKDFERMISHRVCKFPLSDFGGTLVITK